MSDRTLPPRRLTISSRSIEIFLDLVEMKLDAMEIEDRDVRTIHTLKRCRDELKLIGGVAQPAEEPARRGPGRPRKEQHAAM